MGIQCNFWRTGLYDGIYWLLFSAYAPPRSELVISCQFQGEPILIIKPQCNHSLSNSGEVYFVFQEGRLTAVPDVGGRMHSWLQLPPTCSEASLDLGILPGSEPDIFGVVQPH